MALKMNFVYEAERIFLKVLDETEADMHLAFCMENADIFSKYEQTYPESYFTLDYQALLLKGYMQQFLEESSFRYYIFEKENPKVIIGCVGLANVRMHGDSQASLFYKIDRAHSGQGIMNEAISCLLWHAADDFGLHRVEADILPENEKSIAVVKRLGFESEGIARSCHKVGGEWRDHERYSLIL